MEKEAKSLWDRVIEYLPLIEKMAGIYAYKIHGYEYLYQEACMVVYNKISSYDDSRGMSLEGYLISQIRYRFFDLVNLNQFVVYVPLSYGREAHRLLKIQEENKIETGEYLSTEQLKKKVNLSQDAIETLGLANRTMLRSMTTSLSDFYEIPVEELLEDDIDVDMERRERNCEESMIGDVDIEGDLIFASLLEDMYKKLENLTKKQRESILYHLGFMTGREELFRNMAKRFGGSKQNAQQNYDRGIKKMRKTMLEDWN